MESAKYLIIGGGIAGTTAAFAIRSKDPDGRIVIITMEPHLLYSRVALPGFTRGKTSRDRVFLKTAADYEQQRIELKTHSLATALDPESSTITLADGQKWHYQKLLLAPGGLPRTWTVPGAELSGVMPLRTIDQAEEVLTRLPLAKHAVVVGGGFISAEHIQTLHQAGVATTVVIRDPYYWANTLDEESGILLQKLFDQATMTRFLYRTSVESVMGEKKVEGVLLSNGQRLDADLVLVNIGIRQAVDWLEGSGLTLNGGIVTNNFLETNLDSVWAAGDAALFEDPLLGGHHHIGNWANASVQGKTAGLTMVGERQPLPLVSAYSISVFGTNISFVGQTMAHPSMTVVPRGSARSGAYGRILLCQNKVVGATLINRFPERQPLEQLIQSQIELNRSDILDLTDETQSVRELAQRLTGLN